MSAIRDEIRRILREELATLREEAGATAGPAVERVAIDSSADLERFARELLSRAASPDFVERVLAGRHRFALAGAGAGRSAPARLVAGAPPLAGPRLDKTLVTERDIVALDRATRALSLPTRARLTPLAKDEARRRGIRIHRSES